MKRSEINQLISQALEFFRAYNFMLPEWSVWGPDVWKKNSNKALEVFRNQLGWDLTDFGTGDFHKTGLLLFTIRNGNPDYDKKPYAEKIMIVEENQVTPMHFHGSKMEDIINRGGGILCLELFPSNENEEFADHSFDVSIDGIKITLQPGDIVRLAPGQSITLFQGLYHKFYGETGHGKVLVGEVSAVNDDHTDNHFKENLGRFPEIIEDASEEFYLVSDYKKLLK